MPRAPAAGRSGGGIDPRVRVWFNPTIESRYFMLPGIFALLLLVVTSNLSSMAIVREREVGTLEQLNVTPLGRLQLIFGKLLPYAAIGMIDAMIVLAVIVFWFQVPLRGSFWLLIAMSLVYLLTTLGLGLFISTISNTQQQAMMTSTFFFMTPMMYLSGFVFPIENMPAWIQPLTYLIPLRYFVIILRGIFLKGVGLETLWPQALGLSRLGRGDSDARRAAIQQTVGIYVVSAFRRTVIPQLQLRLRLAGGSTRLPPAGGFAVEHGWLAAASRRPRNPRSSATRS